MFSCDYCWKHHLSVLFLVSSLLVTKTYHKEYFKRKNNESISEYFNKLYSLLSSSVQTSQNNDFKVAGQLMVLS